MYYLRQFFELLLSPLRTLLTSPRQLLTGSQRLRSLSLPAKVALLVGIFLIVVWIIFAVDRYYDPEVEHRVYMKHYLIIGVLVIAIPLAVYQVLKIWRLPITALCYYRTLSASTSNMVHFQESMTCT